MDFVVVFCLGYAVGWYITRGVRTAREYDAAPGLMHAIAVLGWPYWEWQIRRFRIE